MMNVLCLLILSYINLFQHNGPKRIDPSRLKVQETGKKKVQPLVPKQQETEVDNSVQRQKETEVDTLVQKQRTGVGPLAVRLQDSDFEFSEVDRDVDYVPDSDAENSIKIISCLFCIVITICTVPQKFS